MSNLKKGAAIERIICTKERISQKTLEGKHMRLVGRFLSAVAVGAALAVTFAVPSYAATIHTAAPAQAASIMVQGVPLAAPANCPSGFVCIYPDLDFTGHVGTFSGSNASWGADFAAPPTGTCVAGVTAAPDNKGGWNDCVSSLYNHTGVTFTFYVDNNCSGASFSLAPNTGRSNLGGTQFNDALSSDRRDSLAC
jgi:peptidase inhibitor family I36